MNINLAKQLKASVRAIDGWLSDGAIGLFALIDSIQAENAIRGNLMEIGCHHGKSAIVLAQLADRSNEHLLVCDLFGQQQQNLSRSGRGDKAIFLAHLEAIVGEHEFVRLLEKRSQDLEPAEVGRDHRIFHVDGGHTVEEVSADLALAAQCIGEHGVIVCDDALHPGWPTVAEAVFRFLFARQGEFSALAVGFNKLVIVPDPARELYQPYFDRPEYYGRFIAREEARGVRRLTLCDQPVTCFIPRHWEGVTPVD